MAEYSPQQERALRLCSDWLKQPVRKEDLDSQVFRLFGFAGTGKTTLAKALAQDVEGAVYFAAYTGKAAYVLQQKGCPGARTIHSLIYRSKEKSKVRLLELQAKLKALIADPASTPEQRRIAQEAVDLEAANAQRPMFDLNTESDVRFASLIVLDECSMIDEQMARDVLSFGRKVLVLGDPAQLPPVMGTGYFTSLEPNMLLTEIHRQARDNPIIEMSRIVREGHPLRVGRYGSSRVIEQRDMTKELALDADQLLVGRNKTRTNMNNRVRALRGYLERSVYPLAGDRLVCLRNNAEKGLLNGAIWAVVQDAVDDTDCLQLHLQAEGTSTEICVEAHKQHFLGRGSEIEWYHKKDFEEFDYGAALTVHKSQGSQWDEVVLFDEWYQANRKEWLYTGITRAAEQLTVVRM